MAFPKETKRIIQNVLDAIVYNPYATQLQFFLTFDIVSVEPFKLQVNIMTYNSYGGIGISTLHDDTSYGKRAITYLIRHKVVIPVDTNGEEFEVQAALGLWPKQYTITHRIDKANAVKLAKKLRYPNV